MTRFASATLATIGVAGAAAQVFAYFAYFEPSLLGVAFFVGLAALGLVSRRPGHWVTKVLVIVVAATSALFMLTFTAATVFGLHWQPRIISATIAAFFSAILLLVTGRFGARVTSALCVLSLVTLVVTQGWWLRLAREDSFLRNGQRIMIWR